MDTARIHELLPDYVRGHLPAEERAAVERALARSEELRRERDRLEAYYGAMNALGAVKAPDDFLEKIHNRIETGGVVKRLLRRLFLPMPVKLPLELAGLAVTAVLILMIYQPFERDGVPPLSFEERSGRNEKRQRPLPAGRHHETSHETHQLPSTGSGRTTATVPRQSPTSSTFSALTKRRADAAEDDTPPTERKNARLPHDNAPAKVKSAERPARTEPGMALTEDRVSDTPDHSRAKKGDDDGEREAAPAPPPASPQASEIPLMGFAEDMPRADASEEPAQAAEDVSRLRSSRKMTAAEGDKTTPPQVSLRLHGTATEKLVIHSTPSHRSRTKAEAMTSRSSAAEPPVDAGQADPRARLEKVLRRHDAGFVWKAGSGEDDGSYTVTVAAVRLDELRAALAALGTLRDRELRRLEAAPSDTIRFVLEVTVHRSRR
jgi:hypothetical protein